MIRVLSYMIAAEAAVVLLLVLQNPFNMLGFVVVDWAKRGRGPIVVKAITGALIVVLSSSLYSVYKIQKRALDVGGGGGITPTDGQVGFGKHLLEAYLLGLSLLLALIIDRTHHCLKELPAMTMGFLVKTKQLEGEISNLKMRIRIVQSESAKRELDALVEHQAVFNKEVKSLRVQVRNLESEVEKKDKEAKAATSLRVQVRNLESALEKKATEVKAANSLKMQVRDLESEIEKKVKEVKAAEADKLALRKQSEGLLLEYDRLLEDYQNLRSQLQSIDWSLSRSDVKKNI